MTQKPTASLVNMLPAVTSISESLQPLDVAWNAVNEMAKLLACEAAVLSLWDRSKHRLISQAVFTTGDWKLPENWYRPRAIDAHPLFEQIQNDLAGVQVQRNTTAGEPYLNYMDAAGIESILVLPLIAGPHTVTGIVEIVDSQTPRRFSEDEIRLGELLAAHAAIAIQNATNYQQAQQQSADLETVRQATLNLTANLKLQDVLDSILENTIEVMPGMANAHFYLYQESELQFGSALWRDGSRGTEYASPRKDGLTYQVARSGKMVQVDNMKYHLLFEDAPPEWHGSIVALPLRYGSRVVGVMNVAHPQPMAFENRHVRILQLLGDQAAISIINARLHDLVEMQARTDPLTLLYNRRALDRRLHDELQRSVRYERTFSLAMIDLDNFKRVNDDFGHAVGDKVLKVLATCLSENVRNTDFLARFGGDEFALLMPETGTDKAHMLMSRLRKTVQDAALELPETQGHALSLSIGISSFPMHGKTAETLFQAADLAMYDVKSASDRPIGIASSD